MRSVYLWILTAVIFIVAVWSLTLPDTLVFIFWTLVVLVIAALIAAIVFTVRRHREKSGVPAWTRRV
jgi:hypothetical protein